MKKLTKIMSVLLGGALALAFIMIPNFRSLASSYSDDVKVYDYTYKPDNSYSYTTGGVYNIPLLLESTGSDDIDFYETYIYLRRNMEYISGGGSESDYRYNSNSSRYYLGLYLDGSLSSTYTAKFTDPLFNEKVTITFKPSSNRCRIWFFVNNTTGEITGISGSEGVSSVSATITGGRFPAEETDWLEPLRTQLHIAADPEFGGNVNHTAEYTGDFALPTEIMAYIKAHEGVTLNYSFYVNDVLQTVTITSDNVVLEEGVDWYGFSYLLTHYGNGVKGGSGGYTIVSGDTLTSIAAKLGTTVQAPAAKNGIKNVDLIYAGAKIAY